jgi:hypothetical protein
LAKGLDVTTPKEKIERVSFTMLNSDLELITLIKRKCLKLGIETNKSELVRAGIDSLSKLSDTKLRDTLASLPKPKIGRKKLNQDSN